MDNNEQSSLDIWNNLSSGVPEEKDEDGNVAVEEQETIFSAIFDFLGRRRLRPDRSALRAHPSRQVSD